MPTTPASPDMGSREVCQRLGIDKATLSRWVRSKRIAPTLQLPGKNGAMLFAAVDVERLAAESAQDIPA